MSDSDFYPSRNWWIYRGR